MLLLLVLDCAAAQRKILFVAFGADAWSWLGIAVVLDTGIHLREPSIREYETRRLVVPFHFAEGSCGNVAVRHPLYLVPIHIRAGFEGARHFNAS